MLRAKTGDSLILLDGSGWEYLVELTAVSSEYTSAKVLERRPASPEPTLSITLYQAVLKGKKLDWVLQKGTEIGITSFVPMLCERCVALPSEDHAGRRWESIIREASEQCGRGRLPRLSTPRTFGEACREAQLPALLLSETRDLPGLKELLSRMRPGPVGNVSLLVGPEGGFTPDEASYAQELGIQPASLGKRILRGETAGLVAAAILLYEAGDLG